MNNIGTQFFVVFNKRKEQEIKYYSTYSKNKKTKRKIIERRILMVSNISKQLIKKTFKVFKDEVLTNTILYVFRDEINFIKIRIKKTKL